METWETKKQSCSELNLGEAETQRSPLRSSPPPLVFSRKQNLKQTLLEGLPTQKSESKEKDKREKEQERKQIQEGK